MYIHEITCIPKIGKTYSKKVSVSSVKIKRSWCDIQNIRKVNKRFNLQCTTATPTPPPPTPTPRIVLKAWSFSSSTVSIFSKGNAWKDWSFKSALLQVVPCFPITHRIWSRAAACILTEQGHLRSPSWNEIWNRWGFPSSLGIVERFRQTLFLGPNPNTIG